MLDEQFFLNPKFKDFLNDNFIAIHAREGETYANKLFKQFKVSITPTILILENSGTEITKLNRYSPPPEYFKDQVEYAINNLDTIEELEKLLEKSANDLELMYKLSFHYRKDGRFDDAILIYDKILSFSFEAQRITVPDDLTGKPINLYEFAKFLRGYALRDSKEKSVKGYLEFLEEFPKSRYVPKAIFYTSIAYTYGRAKGATPEEADNFHKMILERYPNNPLYMKYFLDYCLLRKRNIDDALEIGNQLIAIERSIKGGFAYTYGEILELAGKESEAKALYSKANIIEKNYYHASALYNYADFWNEKGENLQSAEEMAKQSVALRPDLAYYREFAVELCITKMKIL